MSMCVISVCKSAIVSPCTPALYGIQNSPVLNLVHVLVVRICLTHSKMTALSRYQRYSVKSALDGTVRSCAITLYRVQTVLTVKCSRSY